MSSTPLADSFEHELFISYSHKDDTGGWVAALVEAIKSAHLAFAHRPLNVFFDQHDIKSMNDWELNILAGLKSSKVFLAVLSPSYFASAYCRKEWRLFVEHEIARSLLEGGGGLATVYYISCPGYDAKPPPEEIRDWVNDLRSRQHVAVHEFYNQGLAALQREDVRQRLGGLAEALEKRIERVGRATTSPSTVPPFNPGFVGRIDDLRKLRHTLEEKPVGAITAVQGIGGIGKTELAFAYAHAYADAYPGGRYLIPCEGMRDFRETLARLSDDIGLRLTPAERGDLDRAAALVRARLSELGRALLVLDNVDSPDLLAPAQRNRVLPDRKSVHVLATTRLDIRELKDVECLPIDTLPSDDAVRLLEKRRPFKDDDEFKAALRIVNLLGGHALACEVVAVYLQDNPAVSCADFLAHLETQILPSLHFAGRHEDDLTGETYRAQLRTHAEPLIGKLLAPTIDALPPLAGLTLNLASLMAPDAIPVPWLSEFVAAAAPDGMAASPGQTPPWDRLLARLTGLRLLIPTDDARIVRMHRIVQVVVAAAMPEPVKTKFEEDLLAKASSRAAKYESRAVPAGWVWEARMLGLLAGHWLPRQTAATARLASMAASAVASLGDVNTSRRLAAGAETDRAKIATSNPQDNSAQRDWSVSLNQIGGLAAREGKPDEARRFFQQSMEILERLAKALPDDVGAQRDWSVSLNQMGDLAAREGKTDEARRFFQQDLEIAQRLAKALPDDVGAQRDWSVSLDRLGDLAAREGKPDEARRFFQQSMEILQRLAKALPDDAGAQRDWSVSLNQMGGLAAREGKPDEARRFFQQGLDIRQRLAKALPDDVGAQRDWSVSLNQMGDLAAGEGKSDEARRFFQQSMEILERLAKALPDDVGAQRDWSVSLNKMGDLAAREGKPDEARRFFQQSLEIAQRLAKALPDDVGAQRDWSVSLNQMGDLAAREGKSDEARRFFQQGLDIRQRLAKALPGFVEAQRDLVVSHFQMMQFAGQAGDNGAASEHLAACHATLREMVAKGMPLDPPMRQLLDQLNEALGT
jgi:tetratricopeptide (TPR) repeat protein